MLNTTKHPFDPFNIFLVLVLLIMGTRLWRSGKTGYTTQPAKEPMPQPPADDLTGQEHNDFEPVDEGFQDSEMPQLPADEQDINPYKPENTETEPKGTTVTEDIAIPASLVTTKTIMEPPTILPADKSTQDLSSGPMQKR